MSLYEMVLARQVPEPEWYPAGLFGACISRSPKQNRSNVCLACRSKQTITSWLLKEAKFGRQQFPVFRQPDVHHSEEGYLK